MSDTTTATTEPLVITVGDPVVLHAAVIPVSGWRTSEFWLKLTAFAISAAFATGALTNSTVLAVAEISAVMLGALGYTVSRTAVKVAVARSGTVE